MPSESATFTPSSILFRPHFRSQKSETGNQNGVVQLTRLLFWFLNSDF